MEQLDGNVLFTAMPSIAHDYDIPTTALTVATTAYLVASATFIPLGGWLASRFGARRVFCASVVVFALASLGCALSPGLIAMTAFRIAQGFGGALMIPVGRLVVLRGTTPRDLIRATAYITWPALAAPVLAPVIGGAVASTIGWRWIFLLNLPIGAAVLALGLWRIRDADTERTTLDRVGLALSTTAVFGLITGLQLAASGAGIAATGVCLGAIVVTAVAIVHLLRTSSPLFDLRVFRIRTFRAANSGGFAYRLVVTAVPFLMPLLLQDGLGYAPAAAGGIVAAIFIGNIGIKPLTTPLLRAMPFRAVILVASIVAALFSVLFSFVDGTTPVPLLLVALLVSGAFRSIGFTAYATMQFADVERVELSSANTLSSTLQKLATAVGVALAAVIVHAVQLGLPSGTDTLPYRVAFLVMAAIALVPVASALMIPRGAADALRRRTRSRMRA